MRQPDMPKPPEWGINKQLALDWMVQPILDKHCVSCHGENNPKKNINLSKGKSYQMRLAVKNARGNEVVYARSFYAGSSHASGPLSGEILGVLAGPNPTEVEEGLRAAVRCLEHDACFYGANDDGSIALFPHVVTSIG